MPEMTVWVYTGSPQAPMGNTDNWSWDAEPLPPSEEVKWDEGGVSVRKEDGSGAQRWQVPWSSVKYITWREEKYDA